MRLFDKNRVFHYEKLNSTNDEAIRFIKEKGFGSPFIIITKNQLKGRGQKKNEWESVSGKNLTFSVVFFPTFLPASSQFMISKIISLSIVGTLSYYVDDVTIKWPNDIYVGNKKISGILIESAVRKSFLQYSICGIGININQTEFSKDLPNPVSLKQLTGTHCQLDSIFREIVSQTEKYYPLLLAIEKHSVLHELYLKKLYRFHQPSLFTNGNRKFKGKIVAIDKYGRLGVQVHKDINFYNMGEIRFSEIVL